MSVNWPDMDLPPINLLNAPHQEITETPMTKAELEMSVQTWRHLAYEKQARVDELLDILIQQRHELRSIGGIRSETIGRINRVLEGM